mmetsp:Transcript_46750/g.149199  ORF Transcript_46750/g.149199 Transcript_46750/m.149199 type:complete len:269 (-) Transcript_46750:602-1408(-)
MPVQPSCTQIRQLLPLSPSNERHGAAAQRGIHGPWGAPYLCLYPGSRQLTCRGQLCTGVQASSHPRSMQRAARPQARRSGRMRPGSTSATWRPTKRQLVARKLAREARRRGRTGTRAAPRQAPDLATTRSKGRRAASSDRALSSDAPASSGQTRRAWVPTHLMRCLGPRPLLFEHRPRPAPTVSIDRGPAHHRGRTTEFERQHDFAGSLPLGPPPEAQTARSSSTLHSLHEPACRLHRLPLDVEPPHLRTQRRLHHPGAEALHAPRGL